MPITVVFKVNVITERLTDVVGVVGNCSELGNWSHEKALLLDKETLMEFRNQRILWSRKVKMQTTGKIEYRFFVGHKLEYKDHHRLSVIKWETHTKPRSMELNGPIKLPVAEFGVIDQIKQTSVGWLSGQTSIQVRIHEPLIIWKRRYYGQIYRVKCTAMDYRPDNIASCGCGEDLDTRTTISVLDGINHFPHFQDEYGKIFSEGDFIVFKVESYHPENLGFKLDFFVHNTSEITHTVPKYIGFAHILPMNQNQSLGIKTRLPVIGLKNKPIGEVDVDSLIIKSHPKFEGKMNMTYQTLWRMRQKPVEIGHRGMGTSYKNIALVRENTLASFAAAVKHGADMIEFDVMLTKDLVPVVYHDYLVCMCYRKRLDEQLSLFQIPIKDLTLENLHSMKLLHESSLVGPPVALNEKCSSVSVEPFPTLVEVFDNLDQDIAFNIEVKHPLKFQSGGSEVDHYFEHSLQVDKILATVFEHAGERQIIFSSFDPDTCIMLQLKQNLYPVLFLSEGDVTAYKDFRAKSFETAISFALSEGILGVDFHAKAVLEDLSLIEKAHKAGLLIYIWGEEANNEEEIVSLKQHGVDGIIYDRIEFNKRVSDSDVLYELESNVSGDSVLQYTS